MKYLFIICLALLTSCSIINKHKTRENSHTTENAVRKDDLKTYSRKDSAHVQSIVSDSLNEDVIAIEFDNGFAQDDEHIHEYDSPAVVKAKTVSPAAKEALYNYEVGDKIISAPKPIKKILIRNTSQGKKLETSSTEVKAKDSTRQVKTVETVKTSDIKKTDLQKKTKNYTGLVIGIIISLVAGYFALNWIGYLKGWEGIWFLFYRKKKSQNTET